MTSATTGLQLYQRKIDIEGTYAPFPGYTIVAHAVHPLPKPLTALVAYLSASELRKYYSFLPLASYHVTINLLDNVRDEHKTLLQEEQDKLLKQDTSLVCTAESITHKKIILINVRFNNENHRFDDILKSVRSEKLKCEKILPDYTVSWHMTLGHQYRDIENDEIQARINEIIKNIPDTGKFPFDISLNSIDICHYDDMTKFTPINNIE